MSKMFYVGVAMIFTGYGINLTTIGFVRATLILACVLSAVAAVFFTIVHLERNHR